MAAHLLDHAHLGHRSRQISEYDSNVVSLIIARLRELAPQIRDERKQAWLARSRCLS